MVSASSEGSGTSASLPHLKAIITSKERKVRRELTVSRLGSTDGHPQRTLLLVGTPSRARRLRRSSSDGGGGDRSSTGEDGSGGCRGAVDDRGGSSESGSEGGEHGLLVESCLLLYAFESELRVGERKGRGAVVQEEIEGMTQLHQLRPLLDQSPFLSTFQPPISHWREKGHDEKNREGLKTGRSERKRESGPSRAVYRH